MIVVDTTVWIDFLQGRGSVFDRHLTELIEVDAPLALVDIIYCEVLQGIRDEETYQRTRVSLRAHPILRPHVDCLIAATCLEAAAEIYHNDRDFDALARVSDLIIHHA